MKTPFEKAGFKPTDVFTLKAGEKHPKIECGDKFTLKYDDESYAPLFWNHNRSDWFCVMLDRIQLAADADGWIEWQGGACPVEKGTLVDVRFRDDSESLGLPAGESIGPFPNAHQEYWERDDLPHDIIAYRLHQPEADTPNEQFESLAKPVWDGEGLPPVGTECEFFNEDYDCRESVPKNGTVVKIVAHQKTRKGQPLAVFTWLGERGGLHAEVCGEMLFRPIRTEAARQQEEAIDAIANLCHRGDPGDDATAIYNAIAAGKIPGVEVKK